MRRDDRDGRIVLLLVAFLAGWVFLALALAVLIVGVGGAVWGLLRLAGLC